MHAYKFMVEIVIFSILLASILLADALMRPHTSSSRGNIRMSDHRVV